MDDDRINETLTRIRCDITEIKTTLAQLGDSLGALLAQASEHERRITVLETSRSSSMSTIARIALVAFNVATLAVAIYAIVH